MVEKQHSRDFKKDPSSEARLWRYDVEISELQVIDQGGLMQPPCSQQVEYASLDPEVKNCSREVHLMA